VRELKNRLSHYVRQVRAGHAIQVTDRGEVVAELLAPRPPRNGRDGGQRLAELARRGLVTLGARNTARLYRRQPSRLEPGELQRLVDEERGDR